MSNYFDSNDGTRARILKRFSMFDSVGRDLREVNSYDEALKTAGIDYTAEKRPMFLENGIMIPNAFASVKSDTDEVLGVVGNQYNPVSNRDAFAISEEIVNQGWGNYEVGGPSFGSKNHLNFSKAFMVVRGDDFQVGEDTFNSFVIFNNSFDGSTGVTYRVVCQRVVCLNGMVRFLGGKKNQLQINIQHSKTAQDRINSAKLIMKDKLNEIEQIQKEAELFKNTSMTRAEFEKEIIPLILKEKKLVENDKDRQRGEERVANVVAQLMQAYNADDVQNYTNSAYRTILAISDFETHAAPLRDCGNGQIYMNNITKGMMLTTAVAKYIADTRGLRVA